GRRGPAALRHRTALQRTAARPAPTLAEAPGRARAALAGEALPAPHAAPRAAHLDRGRSDLARGSPATGESLAPAIRPRGAGQIPRSQSPTEARRARRPAGEASGETQAATLLRGTPHAHLLRKALRRQTLSHVVRIYLSGHGSGTVNRYGRYAGRIDS